MMEAARTSETLVNFYQTTLRYNPEDSHLRTNQPTAASEMKPLTWDREYDNVLLGHTPHRAAIDEHEAMLE
jgi:hypothetical protein